MSLWKVNKNKTKKHNQPIEIFQGEQRDYINQETGHEIRPSSLATIVLGVCIPKVINPLILDILPDLSDQLMPPSLVNRMLRESPGWGIQPERVHFRLDIRALSSNTAQAMFVSQPPTKCLLMRCSNAFCRQGKDMEVKNPHGIQIANLVKAWEEHEADHEAYQPQGTWLHILENCEGPHPVELELLDGLAITQAEQEIVEHGNQKATSMAHANPFAYRRAYPRSCAPFENQKVVPTPLTCSPCVDGTMKFIRD
ncbi:hypothetical protein HII31_05396 [Pseudocercospora fuligena]|uniref:Uncharacterized protein n=1 Tax=Pseudocercospora fuligena TaxID=685502 RepID=A0A8H6VK24_9PEZI|nr:hypothetical protein HII31_05396 [Pseudocercospora fuligena]